MSSENLLDGRWNLRQLAAFVGCASSRRSPVVSGADGLRALRLAHVILARIAEQP